MRTPHKSWLLGAYALLAAGTTTVAEAETAECSAARIAFAFIVTPEAREPPWALSEAPPSQDLATMLGPEGYDLGRTLPDSEEQRWFTASSDGEGRPATPPAASTVKAFLAAKLASVTVCERVREQATLRGVRLGEPVARGKPSRKTGLYPYTGLEMTVPVISEADREALAYVATSAGPLAGGGFLVLLRRNADGAWQIAGQLSLWIS